MVVNSSSHLSLVHDAGARRTPDDLREREHWLSGQREAFEAALSDAPLAVSLGILVRTATAMLGPGVQAAFFLANEERTSLHHVIGMSEEYAKAANGLPIGPDSVACGVAAHSGKPVLTPDVRLDASWRNWLWAAEQFGYRACWSFPLHAVDGRYVGSFSIYCAEPRDATEQDLERLEILVQTAAMVVSRHHDAERRRRDEAALREARSQLESELADSELLRQLSREFHDEDDETKLYQKLVEAAAKIMQSEVCTVQFFHPERGAAGELEMLASRGLPAAGMEFWKWVRADSGCTCGEVLRTSRRAIAEEVATCAFMDGKPDREALLANGIPA